MDGRRWWNQESSFSRYLESCSPIQHKAFPLSPATQQNERKEGRVLEAKICHCSLGIPKCWQEVGASCNPCCMGGAPTLLSPPHPLGLQLKDKVSCSRVYRANPASHIVGFCVWTIPSSSKFLKRNQIVLLFLTSERNSIPKKSLDFHLHFHLFLFFFPTCCPFFTALHCFASFFTLPLTRKTSTPPPQKRKLVFLTHIKKSILHCNFCLQNITLLCLIVVLRKR